jgi:hypothetical protein
VFLPVRRLITLFSGAEDFLLSVFAASFQLLFLRFFSVSDFEPALQLYRTYTDGRVYMKLTFSGFLPLLLRILPVDVLRAAACRDDLPQYGPYFLIRERRIIHGLLELLEFTVYPALRKTRTPSSAMF